MSYIVFDIETQNIFEEVGSSDPRDLDISVLSLWDSRDDKVRSFTVDEIDQVWHFFEETDAVIGFNTLHFDIPLLNKYCDKDLTKLNNIDLMVFVKEGLGRRVKLDTLANATLGRKKIAHGLEAVSWWRSGEIDKIKKYCEEDVLITRDIFEYARKNNSLKSTDQFGNPIEIPINTSSWKTEKEDSPIQSLF
jgi:DEAD/DEAH box helicase domain-containing protein